MLHKERVIVLYGFKFVVAHWRMNDYVTWPFSDNSGQRSDDLLTINDCHDNRVTKFQSANQGANELLRPMPFLRGVKEKIIKIITIKGVNGFKFRMDMLQISYERLDGIFHIF